jgi:hypothetical protein
MIPLFLSQLLTIEQSKKLNSIIHHIFKWVQTNELLLNVNKTYIVKFTSSKALIYPLTIIHADQTLAIGETIKFLGLHLDSHLSWKSHINVLLQKLSSICFMMRKVYYILNIDTLTFKNRASCI